MVFMENVIHCLDFSIWTIRTGVVPIFEGCLVFFCLFFSSYNLALFKVTKSLLLGLKPIGRVSSKLGRASLPASTLL